MHGMRNQLRLQNKLATVRITQRIYAMGDFFKVIDLLTQLKRLVESRLWATCQILTFTYGHVILP